jgi:hypothetical protein
MKILIVLIVLFLTSGCASSNANSLKVNYMLTLDKVDYKVFYANGGESKDKHLDRYIFDIFADYKVNDKISFHSNVNHFYYKDSDGTFMHNISEDLKVHNTFFKSLYAKYNITDKDAIAVGLVPFNYGSFKEYSTTNIQQGNGLYPLIEMPLEGIHYIRNFSRDFDVDLSLLKIGYSKYKLFDNLNDGQFHPRETKGSTVFSSIFEIRNKDHRLEFNYFDTNYKYNNIKVADNKMFGVGYAIEEIFDTGWSAHAIYGYTIHDSNMGKVKQLELSKMNINPMLEMVYPEIFNFGKVKNSGHLYTIGAKYYMLNALFDYDVEFGLFRFYADDDATTMNRATPNGIFGSFVQRGFTDTFQADLKINANQNIVLRYSHFRKNQIETLGNMNESLNADEYPVSTMATGANVWYLTYYWRF